MEVIEDDTGRVIDIDQISVEPFGFHQLLSTRSEGNEGLPLTVRGSQIQVDGEPMAGRPTVTATMTFHESPKPLPWCPEGGYR